MRFLYKNEIDDYTVTSQKDQGTDFEVANVQDTRLGEVWRSGTIANEVENGDCESTDSPTLDGVVSTITNATWARSAAQAHGGTYSWLMTKTSAAAAGDASVYLNDNYSSTADMHGLFVDKYYNMSLWIYTDAGTLSNVEVTLQEYYGAAWNDTLTLNPTSASAWENLTGCVKINSNTTSVRLILKIDTAEVLNKVAYLDDIVFYLEPRVFLDVGSGNTINPTALGILNHNLSAGANIRLQGNSSDDFTAPTVDISVTYVLTNIVEFITASAQRYWSFLFDDFENTDGYIEVGRLFLGGYTEVSGNAQYQLPKELMTFSKNKQNPSGQLFGISNTDLTGYKMNFSRWSQTDQDSIVTIWNTVGNHTPFILIMKNSLITTFPAIYCYFNQMPKLTYIFNNFWSGALSIMEAK